MRVRAEDITGLKVRLCRQIDDQAENLRASVITLGAGQALVYEQKLREAEMIMQNTVWDEAAQDYVTTVSQYEVPNLHAEADDLDLSLFGAAQVVIEQGLLWATISAIIERKRLGHKRLVMAADTAPQANAAALVDWPVLR
ncbi:hypothetical protein [Devosia sp. 2618]|uniref:hypothetical protein n=1 Tax=Devosia sp. 2618 TaxID=3156454 RepID=UPI0033975C92